MQFDIEHKSVLLGNLSASNSAPAKKITAKHPSGSPLREVAKKWRDAKNKLVIKGLYHLLVAPFQRFHTFFLNTFKSIVNCINVLILKKKSILFMKNLTFQRFDGK